MFRINNLERTLDVEVSPNFKLKPMKFFTKKRNLHKFENKGISGFIINCTSPSTATKAVSTFNSNKRAKTSYQPPKAYHRWFLCADAMNPPHTFVIVTHTHQQTCELLQHVHDNSFMGMPFYLIEPNLSTSRVGDYLHILEHKAEKLYPLRTAARILKKPAPVELPNGSDQTFYFVLEGERINMTRMKFSTSTCTGYQCDRHWGKDGCVCAYGSMGNSLVYEFDFQIPVDPRQFNSETHVASLSSFRTMSVFFHNLVEYTHATTGPKEEKYLLRRRSQVRRLIRFINAHGGWKIIGWCKRGLLSVDGEAEKVENREVNLRLSYVYPQNEKIFKDPLFKSLQIREDFDLNETQLPNLDHYALDDSDDDDDDDSDDSSSDEKRSSDDDGRDEGPRVDETTPGNNSAAEHEDNQPDEETESEDEGNEQGGSDSDRPRVDLEG